MDLAAAIGTISSLVTLEEAGRSVFGKRKRTVNHEEKK